ncbi:MAG: PAS domain-containing protein [Chloroflexi bacterium]|nr:PAS domain-containing protein [Chloroflexota bacterium]
MKHDRKPSFSQILDLTPGAISVANLDGGVLTYWSKGGEQLFGWSSEEAVGQQPSVLLHTRFPRPQTEIEAELVRVGHWEGRLAHTRKDGRKVRTMTRSVLERDAGGTPIAILSLSSDLSQVLGNEDALEISEERFRLLVAGVKDYAIFWLSPLGLVTTWNPGAESMTGYHADEIVGQQGAQPRTRGSNVRKP